MVAEKLADIIELYLSNKGCAVHKFYTGAGGKYPGAGVSHAPAPGFVTGSLYALYPRSSRVGTVRPMMSSSSARAAG